MCVPTLSYERNTTHTQTYRYAYPVTYKSHKKDASGRVEAVEVEADLAYSSR